MSSINDEDI